MPSIPCGIDPMGAASAGVKTYSRLIMPIGWTFPGIIYPVGYFTPDTNLKVDLHLATFNTPSGAPGGLSVFRTGDKWDVFGGLYCGFRQHESGDGSFFLPIAHRRNAYLEHPYKATSEEPLHIVCEINQNFLRSEYGGMVHTQGESEIYSIQNFQTLVMQANTSLVNEFWLHYLEVKSSNGHIPFFPGCVWRYHRSLG